MTEGTDTTRETSIGDRFRAAPAIQNRIGYRKADGTVFAGISPDTGRPMYAMPVDAPQTVTWKQGVAYTSKLDAHGHQDWCTPTRGELKTLFKNRAAIGGFNESGSEASWYWSSSPTFNGKWVQRFSDGEESNCGLKMEKRLLRCVRFERAPFEPLS